MQAFDYSQNLQEFKKPFIFIKNPKEAVALKTAMLI